MLPLLGAEERHVTQRLVALLAVNPAIGNAAEEIGKDHLNLQNGALLAQCWHKSENPRNHAEYTRSLQLSIKYFP